MNTASYVLLSILLTLIVSLVSLLIVLLLRAIQHQKNQLERQANLHLQREASLQSQIQMLMNRIQAGDLKTLLSLQVNTNEEGIPQIWPQPELQTDEAELERLGTSQGLGYELYDSAADDAELAAVLDELGADAGIIQR